MRIRVFIATLSVLIAGVWAGSSPGNAPEGIRYYGVWADKDVELVRTARFSLIFYRCDDVIASTLHEITVDGNTVTFDPRATALFNNTYQSVELLAEDLLTGDDIRVSHNADSLPPLEQIMYRLEDTGSWVLLRSDGEICEELNSRTWELKIHLPDDTWHTLQYIEEIALTEPYDMGMNVSRDNLGECIQLWQLGTSYRRNEDDPGWAFYVGTNRHLYTFTLSKDFLYCRAARIRSNRFGSVFSQNIRLVVRGEERDSGFIGYMAEDNIEKAGTDVLIDNSKFDAECGIAYDIDIYWSLKAIEDNLIRLNGCDQEYGRTPPEIDSPNMLEWFEFSPYSEYQE